jgi:hypothetical protein
MASQKDCREGLFHVFAVAQPYCPETSFTFIKLLLHLHS